MTKVAVIGVGNIGYHHTRIYSSLENVKLVGIADINEKLGKKIASEFHTNYYKDYFELLKKEKPDAISIAVPTFLHTVIAIKAMKYVSQILIEKPLADNTKNAKRILKEAKKYNCNIFVGYVERFNPVVTELKNNILKKYIGKPISISIKRVGLFPPTAKNADVITDLATHDIDILKYFFNSSPRLITATGGKLLHTHYDHSEILFEINGISCFLQTNWITPVKLRSVAITGWNGYIEANYITQDITVYRTIFKKTFINFTDFVLKFGKPKKKIITIKKDEPLKLELKEFVTKGIKSKQLASGEDGLSALVLAERIIMYLNKKQRIKI